MRGRGFFTRLSSHRYVSSDSVVFSRQDNRSVLILLKEKGMGVVALGRSNELLY
jgi:hypothetical protein